MLNSTCKKGTQALNYFARKKDGKINKLKAIKLIYLADRYHIRKYGRPIVDDAYWAMKFGPVGSSVLDIANLSKKDLDEDCLKYAKNFIDHNDTDEKLQNIISKKDVDLDVFSQSDIEALETVYKEFGDKDQFELAAITHEYPEWSRHRKELESGKKRARMDYTDFFSNSKGTTGSIFDIPEEHLALSRDIYEENREVSDLLS